MYVCRKWRKFVGSFVLSGLAASTGFAAETLAPKPDLGGEAPLKNYCMRYLNDVANKHKIPRIPELCESVAQLDGCTSPQKQPIMHFDFQPMGKGGRRILVFSLTHGDEPESGVVALKWMERLKEIKSRNGWRIVPVLNPDGFNTRQRVNANGIDLNRNFPSDNWVKQATEYWEVQTKKDPRRFPGKEPASEPETKCAMKHIEEFKPDFVISIHTPYGVLDFDGPRVAFPKFGEIPWVSIGTYPGSLGRYMWVDRKTPVLTIELKDDTILRKLDRINQLQDISGTIAIRADEALSKASN